jgi:hypothetical protein
MVGLVSFGVMMALISSGAPIATERTERTDGWTRQLRVTLVAILAAHRPPARRRGRTAVSPRPDGECGRVALSS